MPTFQEFLAELDQRQRGPERRQRRQEWIEAVGRLLNQIRAWLAEADPNRLLDIVPIEVQRVEPSLGIYTVPALRIGVGEAAVEVSPVGRDALGFLRSRGQELRAEGRVDIRAKDNKYILYRTIDEGKESWHVLDDSLEPAVLDRSRLEAILQDLLS